MRVRQIVRPATDEAPGRYRVLVPHGMRVRKLVEALPTELVATPADESDPRPKGSKVTGSRYVGPESCPDCGRGLYAPAPGRMACISLPIDVVTDDELAGSIVVACGWDGLELDEEPEGGTDG